MEIGAQGEEEKGKSKKSEHVVSDIPILKVEQT